MFSDNTNEFQLQQQLRDVEAQLASQENKNRALTTERDLLAKYVWFYAIPVSFNVFCSGVVMSLFVFTNMSKTVSFFFILLLLLLLLLFGIMVLVTFIDIQFYVSLDTTKKPKTKPTNTTVRTPHVHAYHYAQLLYVMSCNSDNLFSSAPGKHYS